MALTRAGTLDRADLRDAVQASVRVATESGASRLFAAGLPLGEYDPLMGFARFGREDRFYWEQAARGIAIAGRGAAVALEADARDAGLPGSSFPIARVGAAIADRYRRLDRVGPAEPLFVGGFAFDGLGSRDGDWAGFPAGRMLVPELLLHRRGGQCVATVCVEIESGADPDGLVDRLLEGLGFVRDLGGAGDAARGEFSGARTPAEGAEYRVVADRDHAVFRGQVESALTRIGAADLEKVVLARSLEVFHPGRFGVPGFLDELRVLYPHCTVLACGRDEDTLVAASPELLVSLADGRVESCALAGSAARGRSPEEDVALGDALQESKKEQAEHEAVVRAIRAGLAPFVGELAGPEAPELMRVLGIQHLATSLRGRLRGDCDDARVLDLVASLHPTPAVAGLPLAPALEWIDENEGMDRGWYAGPIGWVDAKGGGEFWLALRCALVRNAAGGAAGVSRARLFAGAGLVEGSLPEAELRETRLKLRALLAPLTEI